MLPWHEVFRLQLFAGAGCEPHAKVRQALIPRTGNTHLLGAVFRRQFGNRVEVASGELRPEEIWRSVECLSRFDAALDPHFVDPLLLPVSKQAHAIPAGFDRIKVIFQLTERQVLIHILAHHEAGLNIESDLREHTQRTQPNHRSVKCLAVSFPRQVHHVPVRPHYFQCRRRRRQVPIFLA